MAAILNSAMLDSDTAILDSNTLLSFLRFIQKHSHSTLTLTQTNSIQLTRWWQPSWILPSWIWPFCTKLWFNHLSFWFTLKLNFTSCQDFAIQFSHFGTKKTSLIHSDSTWWLQPSWNLCHLGFSHFAQKRTSLIHSDSTWWWQPSWILPCWIQTLPSWIQTPCYLLSDSDKSTLTPLWLWIKLIQSDSNSIMADQLDDSAILNSAIFNSDILHKKNFTLSFWLNLMMTAILNSAMLDSDTAILDSNTLLSSLRFIQKHSHSTLTLTQTNSIWLTWWWQPSWILPFWILPSWIQPFCTKNLHLFILT